MKVTVHLPEPLRPLARGRARIRANVDGETVGDLLLALSESHPELARALVDSHGSLRRQVALYVGDADIRQSGGLQAPLQGDVHLVVPQLL